MAVSLINLALACLVSIAAGAGIFVPKIYSRETMFWATEGQGGDAVNLLLVVPLLLWTAMPRCRNLARLRIIRMGTLVYLFYNYFVYAVGVHFNALFLVYCAIVGLSFYTFLWNLQPLVHDLRTETIPAKPMAAVLLVTAFGFAVLWLGQIIPPLISGGIPDGVRQAGLLTSPVHVLDLSLFIPGVVMIAIMLLQRKPVATLLAPILLIFLILMVAAICGMLVALTRRGLAQAYFPAALFAFCAAACAAWLTSFPRRITEAAASKSAPTAYSTR